MVTASRGSPPLTLPRSGPFSLREAVHLLLGLRQSQSTQRFAGGRQRGTDFAAERS
jgi:hypothetical protein